MAESFSFENISDERIARQVLACVVPPEDEITGDLLRKHSAVETIRLALSDEPLPRVDRAKTLLWRRRFDIADRDEIRESFIRGVEAGCGVLIPGDKDWPTVLSEVEPSPPYALWAKGDTSLLRLRTPGRIAFLGTDTPSEYGTWWASTVADELSGEGLHVVAVGGKGIPADAVQAALDGGGKPLVIAPHPLDAPDDELLPMYEAISEQGLLLSECPPGIAPRRDAVEKSHRIATGISGTTLVVETSDDAAPMAAARRAHAVGADVFAVPGDVRREHLGANTLIAEQTADLVSDAEDIFGIVHIKINIDLFGPERRPTERSTARPVLSR
ncbi:DNA-processing protein DprA [Herbiconiux sp.]|uniref:DNA-processing protein DprA n=1 Tax=Microbacteriaceae TaxID=85023 RepID=UPI0025C7375E|nr:DNA-processing protein DprA [Herbiconiux sp.]